MAWRECYACGGSGGGDEPSTVCPSCRGHGEREVDDSEYDDDYEPEPLGKLADLVQDACDLEAESEQP